eukprot:SAG31_NODE_37893_length_300_cov_1.034826_1_plen_56_part_10
MHVRTHDAADCTLAHPGKPAKVCADRSEMVSVERARDNGCASHLSTTCVIQKRQSV